MKSETEFLPAGNILCAEGEKSQGTAEGNFWSVAKEQVGLMELPSKEKEVGAQTAKEVRLSDIWEETQDNFRKRIGDKLDWLSQLVVYYPAEEVYYGQPQGQAWSKISWKQLASMLQYSDSYKISDQRNYLAGKSRERESRSDFECVMLYIQCNNSVDRVVSSLAGYRAGIHQIGLDRVLVLKELAIMAPGKGEFATIDALFRHVLDFDQHRQYDRFKCLLKRVLHSVHRAYHGSVPLDQVQRTFLDLFLVGDSQRGKSFIVQQILQPILGNVIGKPFSIMSGKTEFNDDVVRAILQVCDDSGGYHSEKEQELYAQIIKQRHSNEPTRINGKFREPFYAYLLQFDVNTLNTDPASLKLFPMLIDSVDGLRQRTMALYVNPIPWNVFNDNVTLEQKTDLQSRIRSELPAFIHYLLHEFTPSLDLIGQSFQCKEFIHPKIEKLNRENTREGKFRLFLKDLLGNEKFFGQPIELHNRIVAECGFDSIKHIYQGPVGLGKLLAKLCKIHGDEFTGGKSGIDRKYRYTIQFNDNDLLQDGEGL